MEGPGCDELAALDLNTLTHPEILCALGQLESLTRRLPSLSHRLLARLQREAAPKELGAKSWQAVLSERLGISGTEAHRRLGETTDLGPRVALTGNRWQCEETLVGIAVGRGPEDLSEAAERLKALLDQDGPAPTTPNGRANGSSGWVDSSPMG